MITAAEAMVKSLEQEGVEVVFGYPGAAICPFYDRLASSPIRHILVRQEQNAGHAASGYARIARKPAVCVATSGPGATNLITALATAYMDSIPLVAITGQVSSELLGRDVFQEVDITGSAEPFTKHSYLVKNAADLPRILREAFYIAGTGRQGPVLVDVPIDIQNTPIEFRYPDAVSIRGYKPSSKGNLNQLRRVLAAMHESHRPVICAGGGVLGANAERQVRALAEACSIPVVSTMMGLGAMPTGHPLYFGMLGMYGCRTANAAIAESDLLILVGARVGDRAMQSPGVLQRRTRVIHIDIDPAEIGKNMETNIPLVGDARLVLEQILEHHPALDTASWLDALRAWQREERAAASRACGPAAGGCTVDPNRLVARLSARMEDDGVYVSDVGQNQIWSARGVNLRTGRFITTGGMGTMGYALPAAIGAKLAAPQRQVVAVCGDGALQMSMMELGTLVQHNIAVKLVVLCNRRLGMVREVQDNQYSGRRIAVDLGGLPDFCKIAAAYNIPSAALCDEAGLDAALDALLGGDGPFLLQVAVDPDEPSLRGGYQP